MRPVIEDQGVVNSTWTYPLRHACLRGESSDGRTSGSEYLEQRPSGPMLGPLAEAPPIRLRQSLGCYAVEH
jgi:hypothetical protein